MLLCYPEVLSRRQRDLDGTVRVLRDKCLFTAQQVTEILHRCPFVLREDPGELELKFQVSGRWRVGAAGRPAGEEPQRAAACHCITAGEGGAGPEGARLVLGVPTPVFEVSGRKVADTFSLELA